eukprot:TRINITY_DN3317_c0_g1_i1.p1 TRINITY_DN3317_c0_g1~~TRINITY_DN3317_c0_g1_i1.p1  ORF type:complete len:205 (-),score=34.53 TRINITY_DN3317_c0_g1_i1:144-758(-)
MECSLCLQGYDCKGANIPVVAVCCGNSLCQSCADNLPSLSCPFCRSLMLVSPPPNRTLISILDSPNEKMHGMGKAEVKPLDEGKREIAEADEKDCVEHIWKDVVGDSQPMKKQMVLQKGTYGLAVSNKNMLHMSYLNCYLRVGDQDLKFDLRKAGDLHRFVEIEVQSEHAVLELELECMHILKALANIQGVGSAKYGFILKQLS